MLSLDRETARVTHIKVVPALLIRLINDPSISQLRSFFSVKLIQSGGQRMQPEVRLKTHQLIPSCFVQENFGMSEGMLFFVRLDDPQEVKLETCGRPICPDDEVRLVDDDGREVPDGEVGELTCRGPYTLRGYYGVPEYNAKQFTARRLLLLGGSDAQASLRKLCRRRKKERSDQPRRREDQRRGDREPDPVASGGAERGLRAGARPEPGREDVRLRGSEERFSTGVEGAGRISSRTRKSPSSSCPSGCWSATISRCRRSARSPRRRCRRWLPASDGDPAHRALRGGRRQRPARAPGGAVPGEAPRRARSRW